MKQSKAKEYNEIVETAKKLCRWVELRREQGCSAQAEINKVIVAINSAIKSLQRKSGCMEIKQRQPDHG